MATTVWIVNRGKLPEARFSPAKEFGKLRVVFDGHVSIHHTKAIVDRFEEVFIKAGPDDYLLPTGFTVLYAMAFHHLMEKFGLVRNLVWDRDHYQLLIIYRADLVPREE